jgi:hypothetical protein
MELAPAILEKGPELLLKQLEELIAQNPDLAGTRGGPSSRARHPMRMRDRMLGSPAGATRETREARRPPDGRDAIPDRQRPATNEDRARAGFTVEAGTPFRDRCLDGLTTNWARQERYF